MSTMATTTLTMTELYPEEVAKVEIFDADFARELKANPDVPKEERDKLRRYLKKCENVNHVRVSYKLGKAMRSQHLNLGRLCAMEGIGLQSLSREIRCALASRYYWDVDVVNAQPTLIVQYCEREGWDCKALKQYVETREEILEEMERNLGIERWEAKERVISLLYGGSSEGMTPFLTRELAPEVRRILQNVWTKNLDTLKWLKSQPNSMGKGMAYIFQTEERKVLMAMERALAKRGRSLDVLIHDGGLVRKREGETEFPTRLLREVEVDVRVETGYSIRLALKGLETTIERDGDAGTEYAEKKRMWEETGWKGAIQFKLRSPPCFISLSSSEMEQLSRNDILQNEENNVLADGDPFVKKWLVDPQMKEYNRIVFAPKKEAPEGCFNIWRGFRNEPKEGDISAVKEVLRIICNGDQKVMDFVENWNAHIIQMPFIKTLVAIILSGEEGVGKETYWDFIGSILGEYFLNTGAPENNVFAKFNSAIARILLIKFEEANFQTNKANADQLKRVITCEKENIEKKGKDVITLDSYINVVMTTNHDVPVILSETDRRFVLIKASSEKRGDTAFWTRIHTELAKPEVRSAYHHYLLNRDISGFNPARDRPITDYYRDVKQSFVPYLARFFQRQIELEIDIDYTNHRLLEKVKETAPASLQLSDNRLGRDLKVYVEAGVLLKEKRRAGNAYTAPSLDALQEFLVTKGWWVDY